MSWVIITHFESSKLDLLFVGGQVRSETDLIVLDFFYESNKYGIYSHSCIIVFLNQTRSIYDLIVLGGGGGGGGGEVVRWN